MEEDVCASVKNLSRKPQERSKVCGTGELAAAANGQKAQVSRSGLRVGRADGSRMQRATSSSSSRDFPQSDVPHSQEGRCRSIEV